MHKKIVDYSLFWGKDPLFIQGPGGNFSYKDEENMWIKASGFLLREVSEETGFAKTNHKLVRESGIENWGLTSEFESKYVDLVGDMKAEGENLRPSMEAGFHALIDRAWVLHGHSAGTVLASGNELYFKELKEKFSDVDFYFVEACLPGLEITRLISDLNVNKNSKNDIICIALQNHGVVWAGNDGEALNGKIIEVEKNLREKFDLNSIEMPMLENKKMNFGAWDDFDYFPEALFPDYALFFSGEDRNLRNLNSVEIVKELDEEKLQWAREIIFLQAILSSRMDKFECRCILSPEMILRIKNMELEKIRMKQASGVKK